jgi:hypothetical protein
MDFSKEQAARKTPRVLRRYPQTRLIWSAGGGMAYGAAEGVRALGLVPGADVLIGGIDWSVPSLQAVRRGELAVSFGGHVLEGAWAMVLLHDYHHGHDFGEERLIWRTRLAPATDANVSRILRCLSGGWARTDFKAFSKVYNPALQHYSLSFGMLLRRCSGRQHAPALE